MSTHREVLLSVDTPHRLFGQVTSRTRHHGAYDRPPSRVLTQRGAMSGRLSYPHSTRQVVRGRVSCRRRTSRLGRLAQLVRRLGGHRTRTPSGAPATVRPGTGGLGAHLLESLPASSAKEVVVHGDANPTRPERYSSSSHRQHPATPHDAEAPAVGADIAFAKCGTSDRWRRSRSRRPMRRLCEELRYDVKSAGCERPSSHARDPAAGPGRTFELPRSARPR